MRTLNPARYARARLLVGLSMLAALCAAPAGADVYKWADAEGRLHYTDRPPPVDGRLLTVTATAHGAGLAAVPRAPNPDTASAPAPLPAGDAVTAARRQRTVAADVAQQTAEKCRLAQERYRQYTGARHLYRDEADGSRRVLSDGEADGIRRDALRDVEELCPAAP